MKTTLEDFNTSLIDLKVAERNNEQIQQNHYGDYLMIEEPAVWSKVANYRVWLNHPDNVRQGEPAWQIEYCGKQNNFRWETVGKGNE